MSAAKRLLYVSRVLPDPVMAAIRTQFTLMQEPTDSPPSAATLRAGLSQAMAAIVTLTDRIDAYLYGLIHSQQAGRQK